MLFATSDEFEKIHAAYEEVAKAFKGEVSMPVLMVKL